VFLFRENKSYGVKKPFALILCLHVAVHPVANNYILDLLGGLNPFQLATEFPSGQAEGQASEAVFPADFLHNSCTFTQFQREDFSSLYYYASCVICNCITVQRLS
jgi:hypothetical protein